MSISMRLHSRGLKQQDIVGLTACFKYSSLLENVSIESMRAVSIKHSV